MSTATIQTEIESPWLGIKPICVGDMPPGEPTPDRYVTILDDDVPRARIDLYVGNRTEPYVFEQVVIWQGWVVIGLGSRVYLVRYDASRHFAVELESYFGALYPSEHCLLVASGERLFRLNPDGALAWSSNELGIDGVIVTRVEGSTIEGEGEWDPPGDWRPFRVNLDTGEAISVGS